jgi:ABC-type arginine/histidine transport system permease subunit
MKRLILLLSILFTILLAIGLYYQQQSKQLPINESIFSFVSSSTPIVLQLTLDDRLVETFENADNQAYLFTAAYLQEIKTCYRLAKNNQAIKDVIYNNNLPIILLQLIF